MRKLLVKIIQLLDGTPATYGKRQSGQSVVELALITPILIILLAGLVEIGWFANNYLSLLDVTRAGARRAAVLQDQKSPLSWDNKSSYVPNVLLPTEYQMPNTTSADATANGTDADRFTYRWMPDYSVANSRGQEPCDPAYVTRLFYNEVICTMITTMQPLVLNPTNGIDDIIVSGFALQTVDPSQTTNPNEFLAPYPYRPINANVPQVVVAGRYPTNANECDVLNVNGTPSVVADSTELRNAFDINHNHMQDIAPPTGVVSLTGTNDFSEVAGYNDRPTPSDASHAEKQVGFSLFGNHKIPGTYCVGSEWTMAQIQNLVNLPDYDLTTALQKGFLPSQGLVLVEIYWEHEMLLKIPVLSPVFTAVGNSNGKMVINVWAAFPLSSVEPHILFPCPPSPGTPVAGCSS